MAPEHNTQCDGNERDGGRGSEVEAEFPSVKIETRSETSNVVLKWMGMKPLSIELK